MKINLNFQGKAWKFGNNIDTDIIIAAKYLVTANPAQLAEHCMESIDTEFSKKVRDGDIIVAGENFGCGSSREHAPLALKGCGLSCVIAKSYARIFYRNAINIGFPVFQLHGLYEQTEEGNIISVNSEKKEIVNVAKNLYFQFEPFPEFIAKIFESGGLINYIKLKKQDACSTLCP